MRSLGFSVLVVAMVTTSGTAFAANGASRVISTTRSTVTTPAATTAVLPAQTTGVSAARWDGGTNAPGGWAAYRAPFRGYVLPEYWMQPSFFIDDFASYGFATPQDGFGWSRYYDDAVLTDSTGRVVDMVKGADWSRFSQSQIVSNPGAQFDPGFAQNANVVDQRRPDPRDFDEPRKRSGIGSAIGSIGGALIGGAVGAIAGNLIAGRGERLAGSLIGGGVGALAGLAIGEATRGGGTKHHGRRHRDRDRDYGDYRGRHRGPHWDRDYDRDDYYRYGHGGYETYTTVNYIPVAPITTTTTSTRVIEETVYGKTTYYKHRVKPRVHYHRPRQCTCGS